LFRLPEVGYPDAQPPAPFAGAGGWPEGKRPQPGAERVGPTALPYDASYRPFGPDPPPQSQRAPGGPTALPGSFAGGGDRPTRKGKKRPKTAAAAKSPHGSRGGGVGGYEINVFGPNGGRSYTIVDGLAPPVLGRRSSAEDLRGGSGSYNARPPRQVATPRLEGGEKKEAAAAVLIPWKNDKHWVGHSLHSQEAAEDLPFLL